ncbi:MAG TPA: hypothetical protein VM621_07555 [Luteibacter sp.]|uniref:hypothetical protein n=1 Tax=Luteibacter sp. TaxID=1886636 RepID=UPI002C66AF27|nr:hypothetical protein [Luteibacter sp.]HVI54892.1 hypothetical protein [Luteibacter sp.]
MRLLSSAPIVPLAAVACLAAAAPAAAAERFVGDAYAPDNGQLLYREVHTVGTGRQVVQYQCPDGKAFARKVLEGGGTAIGPDFSFVDARNGDAEGVRSREGTRSVYAKRGAAAEVAKPLPAKKDGVIDAGFDVYVRTHWDAIGKRGDGIPFLLPGRFAFYNVRLVDGETAGGLRRMTMKLDAWYAFAAPTVVLSYSVNDRTLRRFEGMGSIRGENGKLRAVRIEFMPDKREGKVADAAVDEALSTKLDGRCTI